MQILKQLAKQDLKTNRFFSSMHMSTAWIDWVCGYKLSWSKRNILLLIPVYLSQFTVGHIIFTKGHRISAIQRVPIADNHNNLRGPWIFSIYMDSDTTFCCVSYIHLPIEGILFLPLMHISFGTLLSKAQYY